jgi:membrane-associated phospholipid phosphatase
MRTSEWIQAGFATILAVAAWIWPLTARRRWVISLLAACAIFAIMLARASAWVLTPVQVSILRDWLPVVLMLVPYWQTGQFFLGPNERIQARLIAIDRWLLKFMPPKLSFGRFTQLSLEWAYMLCYPMVPLGLATLYAAGLRRDADSFWFLVLVPTYLCYAITPFVPALPPRSLGKERVDAKPNRGRVMNLWLQKYGSIHAISFPSAHVASSLAVSLVLLRFVPVAGVVFLAVSFWIAVAAVAGGYHYAIDVLLGALMTLIVFAVWLNHLTPSIFITAPAIALVTPF